ncbi:alpha/beta hydrolase [Tautonia plasticadhaerens]|uniref:Alpha/beta hydrolase family protein n=1 Tax=Tautonia plasticadhaerens TaxID=2527974 RepID=A0A518GYL6_9BACT|nr:alpha/beta fold hydrolase [Tautonia plasticadhaerens]QDV33667.1 Alpha/beta hydrolase family protein [Tautonia plasticadhaerens]
MSSTQVLVLLLALPPLGVLAFACYVLIRYTPVIGRIFEEKPVFFPLRVDPIPDGEDVSFPTRDGLELVGTYFPARTEGRLGVVVFCHEFLGNRWSALPYADYLRDEGFDLFSFDFRNHGNSDSEDGYEPFQWVCGRETRDLQAALAYLRTRPDRDPAGFGVFGVSRGGGTALAVAADEPDLWAVATDGAFPTRGTMLAYIMRWAEIYVGRWFIWRYMPVAMFAFVGWGGRLRSQWRLRRVFPDIERAASRLAPRPLFMIHGQRDAYINQDIARGLYDNAREPKDFWLVPGAKHNRCRELCPEEYRVRVTSFFRQAAPRGSRSPVASLSTEGHRVEAFAGHL